MRDVHFGEQQHSRRYHLRPALTSQRRRRTGRQDFCPSGVAVRTAWQRESRIICRGRRSCLHGGGEGPTQFYANASDEAGTDRSDSVARVKSMAYIFSPGNQEGTQNALCHVTKFQKPEFGSDLAISEGRRNTLCTHTPSLLLPFLSHSPAERAISRV